MRKMNLSGELKRLTDSQVAKQFSKQINDYEKKVRIFVKDFNLRGQGAKEKGRKQLDEFVKHLKKTRTQVEKRVLTVINEEAKNVNKRCQKLLSDLKTLAAEDKKNKGTTARTKRKSSSRKSTRTQTKRQTRAKSRLAKKTSVDVDSVAAPTVKQERPTAPTLSAKSAE